MNPNTNRRNGLKHEGRVRRWFLDAGLRCLNLASNSPADLLVYNATQTHSYLIEVKRVTGKHGVHSSFQHRPGKNPRQRDALKKHPRCYYAVSFYGLYSNERPVTRFIDATNPPLVIRPDSGRGWDAFLRMLLET